MKINSYVSFRTLLNEWLEDSGHKGEYSEQWIIQKASNAMDAIGFRCNLEYGVALLNVENYKAELPDGFVVIEQAAANVDYDNESTTSIIEIVQKAYGTNCEYRTMLHGTDCLNCEDQPVVIIENPVVNKVFNPALGYSRALLSDSESGFIPMRLQTKSIRNVSYHTKNCVNLDIGEVDGYPAYNIKDGMVLVNFEKGKILMAFYMYKHDEEGFPMIPDNTKIIDAIIAYIEHAIALREYRLVKSRENRTFWSDMKLLKDEKLRTARSWLATPDREEYEYLANIWTKLVPQSRYSKFWQETVYDNYSARPKFTEYYRDYQPGRGTWNRTV